MPSLINRTTHQLSQLLHDYHWFLAGGLLAIFFGLSISAMAGDSAIVDEVAHIPAAYSYNHYGDGRLNPEHPPLIKNLAGLPLQFLPLRFPDDQPAWTIEANGQWESGWSFLYHLGNNANSILFWARLPILILATVFGGFLYWYVRRRWDTETALLALLFYALSPNFIAHSHYVTTDVGASAFLFVALVAWLRFVRVPSGANIALLSLGLAAANLTKFNAVLLYPFLAAMTVVLVVAGWKHDRLTRLKVYMGGLIGASLASLGWIYLYYIPQIINMPVSVQERLIRSSLAYGPGQQSIDAVVTMANVPLLRPLGEYILGVLMVLNRVTGGNITYFNGQALSGSFHWYFPELFALKTQVALLILLVVVITAALVSLWRSRRAAPWGRRLRVSLSEHLAEWTIGLFGVFYFAVAVAGNLNLGIRHILPIYVPLFVVVAVAVVRLARRLSRTRWRKLVAPSLAVLTAWYGLSAVLAYPAYTSYFNELIGGNANASKYFSDSSVDWGQDLLRLKKYVEDNKIERFALDYFGGAEPRYYFCNRALDSSGRLITTTEGYDCSASAMVPWHVQDGRFEGQYLAVSETFLENDRYYSAQQGVEGYAYLRAMTPVAKIGGSIYVYKLR